MSLPVALENCACFRVASHFHAACKVRVFRPNKCRPVQVQSEPVVDDAVDNGILLSPLPSIVYYRPDSASEQIAENRAIGT